MYFPALILGLRRLGHWLIYALFQVALWGVFLLHTLGSFRSAFRGGDELAARRLGPAIRPRRSPGPARSGRFNPITT